MWPSRFLSNLCYLKFAVLKAPLFAVEGLCIQTRMHGHRVDLAVACGPQRDQA